jgi:hypothetical protein
MRMTIWFVALLGLATSLDSYHYDGFFGFFTRSFVRMLTDMAAGFGFG